MDFSLLIVNGLVLLFLAGCTVMTLIGLPGNVALFFTVLAYAWFDGFAHIDWTALGIVFGFIAAGEVVETVFGAVLAKRERASMWSALSSVAGAVVGGLIGTAALPVVGSLLGALLGGFLAGYAVEFKVTGDERQAWRVAKGVFKGQVLGTMLKFSIALAMIVYLAVKMPW